MEKWQALNYLVDTEFYLIVHPQQFQCLHGKYNSFPIS